MSNGKSYGLVSGLVLIALFVTCCGDTPTVTTVVQAPIASSTPIPPIDTPIPVAPTASPTLILPTPTSTPEVLSGFADNNGVRIHYEVEGKGPPLVLLHWWKGSLEDWRQLGYVDALKDTHRLILVDARGHGLSDKPHDPADYVLEKQVEDIVAVLDKLGIDKTHYFGYSMGGKLGWALAKYAPDRLISVIIGGGTPEDFNPNSDILYTRWKKEEGIDTDAVIADVRAFSVENFMADLPGMKLPILVLVGSLDEDYAVLKDAAGKLPNGTFASLQGLDHYDAFLRSDLALQPVTKFLAEVERHQ